MNKKGVNMNLQKLTNYELDILDVLNAMEPKNLKFISEKMDSNDPTHILQKIQKAGSNNLADAGRVILNLLREEKEHHVSLDEVTKDIYQRVMTSWWQPDIFCPIPPKSLIELEVEIINCFVYQFFKKLKPNEKEDFFKSIREDFIRNRHSAEDFELFKQAFEVHGLFKGLDAFMLPAFIMTAISNRILAYALGVGFTTFVSRFMHPVLWATIPLQLATPAYRNTIPVMLFIYLERRSLAHKMKLKTA